MLSFFAIILTLMVIVSISFINVTNNTMYHNTWQQLKSYSDSLIQDSIRYNMATQSFEGFATESLNSNANLLTRQNVHFAIYDTTHRKIFASNGFAPSMSKSDWKKLKKGETVCTKLITPKINSRVSKGASPRMTEVSRPYFYKGKMIAVVSIATFVSTIEQNMHQIKINLIMALLTASLVTLAVSYFLARSITKRIDRLRMATHQIAQGNYNVEVDDNGHDEVADLGRSFNQMTASLRESQQEIRRQEERRRQFMANAAHEMRTPLTTINGILEGLQYDAIPEEDKKHSIQLMQNDTRRLIRLVNDNLDYELIDYNLGDKLCVIEEETTKCTLGIEKQILDVAVVG